MSPRFAASGALGQMSEAMSHLAPLTSDAAIPAFHPNPGSAAPRRIRNIHSEYAFSACPAAIPSANIDAGSQGSVIDVLQNKNRKGQLPLRFT
jgi:hypothetical protein